MSSWIKDLLVSYSSLFWRATNFERCSEISPGLTFGVRVGFFAPPCFSLLVVFFGVVGLFVFCCCFLWFCVATLLTLAGLQLVALFSDCVFLVLGRWCIGSPVGLTLFVAFNCFASCGESLFLGASARGMFSESSLVMTSGWSLLPVGAGLYCGDVWGPSSSLSLLYLMSRSSSDSLSHFQIFSFVRAFCLSSFLSKQ